MLTIIVSLALAFLALLQHHRRTTERHDRVVDAWVAALRLLESRGAAPARRAPRTKPAPARLPAPQRRRA